METTGFLQPSEKDMITMPQDKYAEFGANSAMKTGFKSVHRGPSANHPLEASLQSYDDRMLKMRMDMLRHNQGLYAPTQLRMELMTTAKGAKRLPCLPTSHLSRDVILGNDITLSAKDIFNDPTEAETMGDPHLMAEHNAGLKML